MIKKLKDKLSRAVVQSIIDFSIGVSRSASDPVWADYIRGFRRHSPEIADYLVAVRPVNPLYNVKVQWSK